MSFITKVRGFFKSLNDGAPPPGHGGSAQSPTSSGGDLGTMPNASGAGTEEGDSNKADGR